MKLCSAITLLVASLSGTALFGATLAASDGSDAVEASRQALDDAARFPWYDSKADGIRSSGLDSEKPLRQSPDWVWESKKTNNRSAGPAWERLWRMLQYVVWFGLAALIALLIFVWIKAALRGQATRAEGHWTDVDARKHEAASIKQLPFHVSRPTSDLLESARRHYLAQDYRQAIVYLFSYQLVQLDRHQHIRLAKSKTNRQYLNEVRSMPSLRQLVTQTMLAFEDAFFGHYDLDRARFESCWNRLDEFDGFVQQPPGV